MQRACEFMVKVYEKSSAVCAATKGIPPLHASREEAASNSNDSAGAFPITKKLGDDRKSFDDPGIHDDEQLESFVVGFKTILNRSYNNLLWMILQIETKLSHQRT